MTMNHAKQVSKVSGGRGSEQLSLMFLGHEPEQILPAISLTLEQRERSSPVDGI
jgi:hypothetical protein